MKESMPAWLICDAIIAKAREELLSQAIVIMHEQIEKRRISLEGQFVPLHEGTGDKEKDMFLLSQLVREHANIERQFASYIEQAQIDKKTLIRADELEKFLLSLKQIILLHDYARACESWLVEVEKELKEKTPEKILGSTIKKDEARSEIAEYLIRDNSFSKEEKEMLHGALKLAKG